MDGKRFDELTRALASKGTRRGFARGLLGLGGAAAFGNMAGDADARVIGSRPTVPPPPPPQTTTRPPITTPAPDPCPGQANCSIDGCCSGTCTPDGRCCVSGRTLCGYDCCATREQCCGKECCLDGHICIGEELCCPAAQYCGGVCCSGAGQQCCGGRCLQPGQCCSDQQCPNSPSTCQTGVCNTGSNTCGLTAPCASSPGTVCCGGACVPLGTLANCLICGDACGQNQICTGSGCVSTTTTLAPTTTSTTIAPETTTTSTTETPPTTTTPTPCTDLGDVCCPDDRICDFGDEPFCCEPTAEHPGYGCCPGNVCCDCFFGTVGGHGDTPFCCGSNSTTMLCQSPLGWEDDSCVATSRYLCINGRPEYRTHVCDNDLVCNKPCCGGEGGHSGPGGTCCSAGTECVAGACVPPNTDTCQTDEHGVSTGCPAGYGCTTVNLCGAEEDCVTRGTCCPNHRITSFNAGTPWSPHVTCCADGQDRGPRCNHDGQGPSCRSIPDLTCTGLYSFRR